MLSGPAQAGLATHKPTVPVRLAVTKSIEYNAILRLVGCQRHTSQVSGPGDRAAQSGSGVAETGCPAHMPGPDARLVCRWLNCSVWLTGVFLD